MNASRMERFWARIQAAERAAGLMRTSSMPPFQASPPQVCWPMRKRVLLGHQLAHRGVGGDVDTVQVDPPGAVAEVHCRHVVPGWCSA